LRVARGHTSMDRRQLIKGALASPFAFAGGAFAKEPIYIGDMHYHLLFIGSNTPATKPLAKALAAGNATLVAWSLVGDLLWLRPTPQGFKQNGTPGSGVAATWFKEEMARIKAHLAEQKLKIVQAPGDVDLALKGDPHVVLATEGATFLDGDISQLQVAYDLGIRHIQLVHYIRNTIGDFQTEKPEHNGLTPFGRKVVEECNRLGILVDLAHATNDMVAQVLEIAKAPVVWSHSSVTQTGKPDYKLPVTKARQLSLDTAKAITSKGGVVGLWAIRSDAGPTVEAYANRLAEMADWLGEDHVAFGTDMNGIQNPVITGYADLRRVVEHWERKKMDEAKIRKLAIENYARVLKQALAARQG
jgi:membrane dipeptidase